MLHFRTFIFSLGLSVRKIDWGEEVQEMIQENPDVTKFDLLLILWTEEILRIMIHECLNLCLRVSIFDRMAVSVRTQL